MIARLYHWAFREPVLPSGHHPDCRAGTLARPGEPAEIVRSGEVEFRIVPMSACRCNLHELRPPSFYEAVSGISQT